MEESIVRIFGWLVPNEVRSNMGLRIDGMCENNRMMDLFFGQGLFIDRLKGIFDNRTLSEFESDPKDLTPDSNLRT